MWWRTDSERANKDTENVGISRLLEDRVPSHQEFVRLRRLKSGLACRRVVPVYLVWVNCVFYGVRRQVRTGVAECVKRRFVNARLGDPT